MIIFIITIIANLNTLYWNCSFAWRNLQALATFHHCYEFLLWSRVFGGEKGKGCREPVGKESCLLSELLLAWLLNMWAINSLEASIPYLPSLRNSHCILHYVVRSWETNTLRNIRILASRNCLGSYIRPKEALSSLLWSIWGMTVAASFERVGHDWRDLAQHTAGFEMLVEIQLKVQQGAHAATGWDFLVGQ